MNSGAEQLLVVGIAGSPRRNGNSEMLLDKTLDGVRDGGHKAEKILLTELKIGPCLACDCCRDGECVQRDDMDNIYKILKEAAGLVVASPIYFYGPTAQLKCMIDRCQYFWHRQGNAAKHGAGGTGRPGALIAIGATKGEQLFSGTVMTARYFFKAINFEYKHELLVRGMDNRGEVAFHPNILEAAYKIGRDFL